MANSDTSQLTTHQKLFIFLVFLAAYTLVVAQYGGTHVQSLFEATSAFLATITLSVLLGFRTNSAYDRWWEGRKLWGQLTNNTRNLCLKADAFAPGEADWKRDLARELSEFPVLVKDHLRQLPVPGKRSNTDPSTQAREHAPLAAARRICELVNNLRTRGLIDGFQQMQLDPHVSSLMDICGSCERIKLTPIASSYRMIFRVGVALNVFGLPWFLVPEFHLWSEPVVLIAGYFLIGLELTAENVEEPFGMGFDKLPLENICTSIQTSVKQILGPVPAEAENIGGT